MIDGGDPNSKFKLCESILIFENKDQVHCEVNKDHKGNHKGLYYEWEEDGVGKNESCFKKV